MRTYTPEQRARKSAYVKDRYANNPVYRARRREQRLLRTRRRTLALRLLREIVGCVDCGTREGKLDLDHRPGTEKRFDPSRGASYSRAVFFTEILKCDVRCGSCHRRRHLRTESPGC